jgi:hypothetical protein
MSYDYMLYRAASGAGDIPEGPADLVPLGTHEQVADQVERLFPGFEWRERHGQLWWGVRDDPGYVEVWLHVGMDPGATDVTSITLKRVDRLVVERVAGTLGLVAFDPQTGEAYRPGRSGWVR